MAAGFISQDNFLQKLQVRKEEEKILNWTEFPSNGEIFRITRIENIKTKYGESSILHVEDVNGDGKKVWAPSKLLRDIEGKESSTVYFTSLGQVQKDTKTYNNFDLIIVE